MHNLGLLDMYPYDASAHELPDASGGHEWVVVKWGRMGLGAWYLAPVDDPLRRVQWRHANGATDMTYDTRLEPQEMLAWSRWQLDWLHERQVHCVTEDTATVTLAPVARTGGAVAMAAVAISRHEVIVVESRRNIGYDRPDDDGGHTDPSGWRAQFPNLAEEGVLVYTVNTLIGSGQLPVKVAGDSGNGQVDDFPVLQRGESVTLRGYTITVTGDDDDTHTVTIARSD